METRRLIGLIGITTLVLFLSGFGTQAVGQGSLYWIGGTGLASWNNGANWSTSIGGSASNTVPTGTTNVYILTDGASITVNQGLCASLTIGTLIAYADITLTPSSASARVAGLYIGSALTLFSGSSINIGVGTTAPAIAIEVDGAVTLHSGDYTNSNPTEIYSTFVPVPPATKPKFLFGQTSTLTMGTQSGGDWRVTYFGTGINSWITRDASFLLTDVHFKDVITVDCELLLGSKNIWLGKDARVLRSGDGNQTQKYVEFAAQPAAAGMLIQNVDYWKDVNGDYTPGDDQPIEFPVGTEKHVAIKVDVKYAHELGELAGCNFGAVMSTPTPPAIPVELDPAFTGMSWSNSATVPFRGVGIRAVGMIHPKNMALNRYQYYWVVQNIGLFQDWNEDWFIEHGKYEVPWNRYIGGSSLPAHSSSERNDICIFVEVHPGYIQGSPQAISAARYSNNHEDYQLPTGYSMGWYTDGTNQIPTPSGSGRVFVSLCPTSGFGDVTIANGGDPLPVELTSFSARYLDGNVRLKWQTATELNNFGFAIERSVDGESWEDVGFVEGHGTSFSPKQYEHMDVLPAGLARLPQLAYRLRQMDRDGTTDYSNIVFVKTGEMPSGIELYAAYPNPFNPATTISFAISEPANVTLKVYNTLGQVVATLLARSEMDAGLHTVPFNGDLLPSGIYMAVLEANGAQQHQKLVLNK